MPDQRPSTLGWKAKFKAGSESSHSTGESPFFAIPEMGPIRFREQKIGDHFACGGPRTSCVRHVSVLRYASHYDMATANDLTPFRFPHVLSPPALSRDFRQNIRAYGYAGVVVHRSSAAAPSLPCTPSRMGLVGGLLPAVRAARLDIIESLRAG